MHIDSIFEMYEKVLRMNAIPNIVYFQITLKNLREMDQEKMKPEVLKFVNEHKDFPEEVVVVVTSKNISILVNDQGEPLTFA